MRCFVALCSICMVRDQDKLFSVECGHRVRAPVLLHRASDLHLSSARFSSHIHLHIRRRKEMDCLKTWTNEAFKMFPVKKQPAAWVVTSDLGKLPRWTGPHNGNGRSPLWVFTLKEPYCSLKINTKQSISQLFILLDILFSSRNAHLYLFKHDARNYKIHTKKKTHN